MDGETIDLDDWDGVYYDAQCGEFFRIDTIAGDIALIDMAGNAHHIYPTPEDFEDDTDEFHPVSEHAVENPAEVVNRFINEALNQKTGSAESIDLQYALEMTEIVEKNVSE